jgi:two-component system response regulator MprA
MGIVWILVVEDEPAMADLLRQGLEEANHTVTVARDGAEGLHAARTSQFDAIVLDVMLPQVDGVELTRRLRTANRQTPILMLTARDAAADIVKGLDAGADDYLTKPFSWKVLLARLRAISRRAARPAVSTLQVDDLLLDPASSQVRRGGTLVNLTATEFRILEFLMRRAGRVVSRSAMMDAIWGFEEEIESNTVDAFIKLLRDKIDRGRERKLIHTVRGFGYVIREGE